MYLYRSVKVKNGLIHCTKKDTLKDSQLMCNLLVDLKLTLAPYWVLQVRRALMCVSQKIGFSSKFAGHKDSFSGRSLLKTCLQLGIAFVNSDETYHTYTLPDYRTQRILKASCLFELLYMRSVKSYSTIKRSKPFHWMAQHWSVVM